MIGGALSGLFSVGGATFAVPAMTLGFGLTQAVAQGMALALVAPGTVVGVITYAGAGEPEKLRARVLSGAYRLVDRTGTPGYRVAHNAVEIWATGVMVPEAIRASEELLQDEIYASVVNCVSPDLVYRNWQSAVHRGLETARADRVTPPTAGPVVTVLDGHPSALAWVGSMLGTKAYPLGVTQFGESGTTADLYKSCKIDWESIYMACDMAVNAG